MAGKNGDNFYNHEVDNELLKSNEVVPDQTNGQNNEDSVYSSNGSNCTQNFPIFHSNQDEIFNPSTTLSQTNCETQIDILLETDIDQTL